jgi:hypothetical protein
MLHRFFAGAAQLMRRKPGAIPTYQVSFSSTHFFKRLCPAELDMSGVRLVAIAKEREGHEEFSERYWKGAELYFDTADGVTPPAAPSFAIVNGEWMALGGLASYLFGGEVSKNLKRCEKAGFEGNLKGEGTKLGAVLVLDGAGKVLLHHKEQSWGDHPSDEVLSSALAPLCAAKSPSPL